MTGFMSRGSQPAGSTELLSLLVVHIGFIFTTAGFPFRMSSSQLDALSFFYWGGFSEPELNASLSFLCEAHGLSP